MIDARHIRRLTDSALKTLAHPDPRFPPSAYYRFLKLLAAAVKPNLSVELGVCGGGGSLHLAMGWPGGTVVGIDCALDYAENIEYVLGTYKNFHFWHRDSVEAAPDVADQFGLVDILFIDTVHTYERTMQEYHAWLPHLSRQAVICLDDLFRPGMDQAWEEMPIPKMRLDRLHTQVPRQMGGGFGVVWSYNGWT